MSDTKWRKLLNAARDAGLPVKQFVVKFIDVDEPQRMDFPPSLRCPNAYMVTIEFGPVELRSIEWMDLEADIEPVVRPLGHFPLEAVANGTRVVGYRA